MKLIFALALLLIFPVAASLLDAAALGSGSQTCPASTSSTKQISTTPTKAQWIWLQTPAGNSGTIRFGGPAISSTTGVSMAASTNWLLPAISNIAAYDLSQLFISCSNANDTIVYTYLQ